MSDENGKENGAPLDPGDLIRQEALRAFKGLQWQAPNDEAFSKKYPHLFAWLTWRDLGNGYEKESCFLILKAVSGGFQAVLIDPSLKNTLSVDLIRLLDFPGALEKELRRNPIPWIRSTKKTPTVKKPKGAKEDLPEWLK